MTEVIIWTASLAAIGTCVVALFAVVAIFAGIAACADHDPEMDREWRSL